MRLPLTNKVKDAYEDFEVSRSALPEELKLGRAHISFILGSRMNLGFSYLSDPEISLSGLGAHFSFTILDLGRLYTTLRLQYGSASKSDFFESKSTSFELSQSLNFDLIDFYGSVRFYMGELTFVEDENGYALPAYTYSPEINNYEALFGLDLVVNRYSRLTLQLNYMDNAEIMLVKFSLGVPLRSMGMSRTSSTK
jgi:hypothetical protein